MKRLACCLFVLLWCACGTGGGKDTGVTADNPVTPDAVEPAPDVPAPDPGQEVAPPQDVPIIKPDYGEVYVSPSDKEFLEKYKKVQEESKDLSTGDLFAKHYKERPFLKGPEIDPLKADYMDLIDGAYQLTKAEKDRLAALGFVVAERVAWDSHPAGYLDIFQKDLPVLVTTDSILFSMHKSYDLILKTVEEKALIPMLGKMLAEAHSRVKTGYEGLADAASDVDLFYTVARSLLAGKTADPIQPANAAKRDELLALIEKLEPKQIELFGRPYPCPDPMCAYDFSQFKPRGHYTDSEELKRYFKAMIWLGRTEFALTRFARDFAASFIVLDTVAQADQMKPWAAMDRAIQVFVGKSDNLTMEGFAKFLIDQKADAAAVADPVKVSALMAALEKGGYAEQKIMSQIIQVDPFSDTPEALPPIFEFYGQRFVIDSYVFANVTFDRIVFKGQKVERYLPKPLDAMFVLGFQEALPLLKDELDSYHYAGNMNVLRYLVDSYDASFWSESMYNTWLDAIRALAADTTAANFPDAARTQAFARRVMHAGLASWAELRHDTILYAKQSYTGAVCDYPDGYVEPFPEFFGKVAVFAGNSKVLFASLDLGLNEWDKKQVAGYFEALSKAAATLSGIADKQVKGQPRTPEETAFIKSLVVKDSMCGAPPFSGWYADLFFGASDTTFELKPTIADVHTDPNTTQVLHVGTGRANLMVMVADTSCGVKAYAGPASSYYEDLEPNFLRLTDEEWLKKLDAKPAPARPGWVGEFLVPAQ